MDQGQTPMAVKTRAKGRRTVNMAVEKIANRQLFIILLMLRTSIVIAFTGPHYCRCPAGRLAGGHCLLFGRRCWWC